MASSRPSTFKSEQIWREAREPTFWLDKALRFVWVNQAWEEFTGISSDRIVGLVCKFYTPFEQGDVTDLAASFHPPARAMEGHPARGPAMVFHARGDKIWCQLEFWPFHDALGDPIGFLGRVFTREQTVPELDSKAQDLHEALLSLRRILQQNNGYDSLIGEGDAHDRLLDQIRLASVGNSPVLIIGEPGSGKRFVARTIHELANSSQKPITFVDVEALPVELLEERLFDQIEKPEASRDSCMSARTELSTPYVRDIGTLALGDILLLPRDIQARLAKALQPALGWRLLALTAGDPEVALRSEIMRADFYYSVTSLVIRLNPLRERREELLLLAQHLLERVNRQGGLQKLGFTSNAQAVLMSYDWPGNLNELARVIRHAHGRAAKPLISADDLPSSIRGNLGSAYLPAATPPALKPLDLLLTDIERRLIENALVKARRNKTRAAELLGISRPRLYRRVKELNLEEDPEVDNETGPPFSTSTTED